MTKSIEQGYPRIHRMASGEDALVIGKCSYDEFPYCGQFWASYLKAQVLGEVNGPDERLLHIRIGECEFFLAFDEFSYELSIEPQNSTAGKMIPAIRTLLTQSS